LKSMLPGSTFKSRCSIGTANAAPDTGALIGTSKGEVKGAIEIIDYFGPDGAVAVLHSGGQVQEGDFVQLY
ncbi:MAG: hypothetical protein WCG27_03885, partial [Pseudomonadota bacterium]